METNCYQIALGYAKEIEEAEKNGELLEYMEDSLDYELIMSSAKTVLGVSVLLAFGGPTVVVNTQYNRVECHWVDESAFCDLGATVSDEIERLFTEI